MLTADSVFWNILVPAFIGIGISLLYTGFLHLRAKRSIDKAKEEHSNE